MAAIVKGITLAQFNALKAGDKIEYCDEGGFTVDSVHGSGENMHLHVTNSAGESITLEWDDASEIALA